MVAVAPARNLPENYLTLDFIIRFPLKILADYSDYHAKDKF